MRALVTGAGGQLGRELVARLGGRLAAAATHAQLDVADAAAVQEAVARARPDVVFNAAAYNRVDAAESEPLAALAVNAAGVWNLARAAGAAGALLVHVSTDYVFDGLRSTPYAEDDLPRPLGVYGVSKRAGELMLEAAGGPALLVRTSGVFGPGGSRSKGGSFVDRILDRARSGAPLRVVDDQVFAPTYAPDLAGALIGLAEDGARGVLHVVGEGSCSWHELAVATLELAGIAAPVAPVRAAHLALAARRPAYSVLSTARYRGLGRP
ncbi:MAG TPA: dTDP-4-dehydrorhamnose reductase, partial [Vicinamibacteria bacterium]|nr:dTDP-4-dehydrorhamnose reductase [Vicinamibacteria bacterium]